MDYSQWKNENNSILENFHTKNIIMTYTGGKDSSVVLDFLMQAAEEYDLRFETHAILFPKHVFLSYEINNLDLYWKERGINIIWHEVENKDDELIISKKKGLNPCLTCHRIKREYFTKFLKSTVDSWKSLVIIVNFTLWDLVSYSLEQLLNSTFQSNILFSNIATQQSKDRFLQTSQRFYQFFTLKDGYSIYKPLLKYNDPDIQKIVSDKKIPLSTVQCDFKKYTPKRLFANCYKEMNLCFNYHKVLEFAKNSLNLYDISKYENFDKEEFFSKIL